MKAIAAVDLNWAIGFQDNLLIRIPNDQKNFRKLTTGHTVVLGRKTLDTFPGKQPLKNRVNIILSRDESYTVKDALVVHSVDELLEETKKYDPDDVYIIGGASVYEQMLPYCDTAIVTKIDHEYEADAFFPNLDKAENFRITAESDEQVYFDITYSFVKYERIS